MSIPKRLKAERERLGLSQPQMGELAGAGKTTVINWEKGASAPDALQLAAMADAGADVLYILTGQRSQGMTEEELLPPDERVLLESYRKLDIKSRQHLIATGALLSAGLTSNEISGVNAERPAPKAALPVQKSGRVSGGSVVQNSTGDSAIQIGKIMKGRR